MFKSITKLHVINLWGNQLLIQYSVLNFNYIVKKNLITQHKMSTFLTNISILSAPIFQHEP